MIHFSCITVIADLLFAKPKESIELSKTYHLKTTLMSVPTLEHDGEISDLHLVSTGILGLWPPVSSPFAALSIRVFSMPWQFLQPLCSSNLKNQLSCQKTYQLKETVISVRTFKHDREIWDSHLVQTEISGPWLFVSIPFAALLARLTSIR